MTGELLAHRATSSTLKGRLASLSHPPLSDRRFWVTQALVVAVLLVYLDAGLARSHSVLWIPGFVWILLLLVPVAYAGAAFGSRGSFGAALGGTLVVVIEELLLPESAVGQWATASMLVMVLVTALLIGDRFEEKRRLGKARAAAKVGMDLPEPEECYRLAFENNIAGMIITHLDGHVVEVNRSFCAMLDYPIEELLGQDVVNFTHPEDKDSTREMYRRLASGEVGQVSDVKRYVSADGSVVFGDVLSGVIKNEGGAPLYCVSSVKDATQEHALAAQLSHQALHDPLTGLANRALFEDRFSQAREQSARRGGWDAVLLVDLDDFKVVNDTFGHHVGDQLLVELALRLEKVTRKSDTLCRLGGDEFLYLATGLTSRDEAEAVADRLAGGWAEPFLLEEARLEQKASIGVVTCSASSNDYDQLLRDADAAMYEAKRRGKGRQVVFSPEMSPRTVAGAYRPTDSLGEERPPSPAGALAPRTKQISEEL
ncbi:MAG: diguanylate cyclase domain-containing protein [Acidimicrobiales bacterium]